MDDLRRLALTTIAGMDQIDNYIESEDEECRRLACHAVRMMILGSIDNDDFVAGLFHCIRQSAEKTAQGDRDEYTEDST